MRIFISYSSLKLVMATLSKNSFSSVGRELVFLPLPVPCAAGE